MAATQVRFAVVYPCSLLDWFPCRNLTSPFFKTQSRFYSKKRMHCLCFKVQCELKFFSRVVSLCGVRSCTQCAQTLRNFRTGSGANPLIGWLRLQHAHDVRKLPVTTGLVPAPWAATIAARFSALSADNEITFMFPPPIKKFLKKTKANIFFLEQIFLGANRDIFTTALDTACSF